MGRAHGTYKWQQLREKRKAIGRANNEPCGRCGRSIDYTLSGRNPMGPTVDHTIPIDYGGELLPSIEELRMAHNKCNSRGGARITNMKKKNAISSPGTMGTIRTGMKNGSLGENAHPAPPWASPPSKPPGTPEDAPTMVGDPRGTPEAWEPFLTPWLSDLVPPPLDVAWPRHMTVPHPRAVGSRGLEAEEWIKAELKITLRWWQRLALRRQLEIDENGELVWFSIIESTPRRSGKSLRIRATALWRLHEGDSLGEPQLITLTGKDLSILREIIRRAWLWADPKGLTTRKANGQEELELPDSSRWIVRARDSIYGYDTTYGVVDEAWGVPVQTVDDGLEPSLLERCQPQLHLTSTAHRRATPLMRVRRAAAIDQIDEPSDTLILDWGAPPGCKITDRQAWKAASPHWSADRERYMDTTLRRLMAGLEEPDPDEPDPEQAFRSQLLNEWPAAVSRINYWLPMHIVSATGRETVRFGGPLVGAIESSMHGDLWSACVSDGKSVSSQVSGTLTDAIAWLEQWECVEVLAHQAVTTRLPASWPIHPVTTGEATAAAGALLDAVRDGEVEWDSADAMAVQFSRVVTTSVPGGIRISDRLSRGPVDAVKALSWAFWRASTNAPVAAQIW